MKTIALLMLLALPIAAVADEPIQVKEFFRNSALMAKFFLVQDPDGYKIEVLQRQGRYT